MAKTDLTKTIMARFDRLKTGRQNWETHWQEVADYMQPRKADVSRTRSRGDKRTELIFDSSPIQAVELLAASLHGMLTNPSTPWFSLRYKDEGLDSDDEAKLWLEGVTDTMYTAFNRSNFQQEIFELYHDLITFGTAAMFIEEDEDDILKFSTRHINEIYIAENDKGRIDTVFRKFKMSARAAIQKFGTNPDFEVLQKKNPYEEVDIIHAIYPRDDFDVRKQDQKNMPFECGFDRYVNLDSEISFLGKEKLKKIKKEGIKRKLMGVKIDIDKISLTKSLILKDDKENFVGNLRSACYSPHFKKVIGIAMINEPYCKPSTMGLLEIEGNSLAVKVCDLPFI